MPFTPWPWPPEAGAPPPRAGQDTASTAALERRPVEEGGSVAAAADSAQEGRVRLPSEDYFSNFYCRGPGQMCPRSLCEMQPCSEEVKTQEHGEKINKYQGMLAARLKAKYFSNKAFGKGDVFEEIVIQSETIRLSRWPFTRIFADPAKFCLEKSYNEKDTSPSLAGAAMLDNQAPHCS